MRRKGLQAFHAEINVGTVDGFAEYAQLFHVIKVFFGTVGNIRKLQIVFVGICIMPEG